MILINEQWYEGRDNMIVKGNFCMNSSCKNYWEDNCTKTLGNDDYNISIDENGKCMDYEYGVSDWYEEEIRGEII